MTDTKQAVVRREGRDYLDLTAPEFIAPIRTDEGLFFVFMKPYKSADMRELLKSSSPKMKVADDVQQIIPGNDERYVPFFDRHWAGRCMGLFAEAKEDPETGTVIRIEASREAQEKFFADNPSIKIVTAKLAYGLVVKQAEHKRDVGIVLSELAAGGPTVKAEVRTAYMNGAELPEEVSVALVFHCAKESQADRIAFKRATETHEISQRNSEMSGKENYGEIERLFDSLIESVDGLLVADKPCELSNKNAWVGLVPFWFKRQVMHELFRESRLKN